MAKYEEILLASAKRKLDDIRQNGRSEYPELIDRFRHLAKSKQPGQLDANIKADIWVSNVRDRVFVIYRFNHKKRLLVVMDLYIRRF